MRGLSDTGWSTLIEQSLRHRTTGLLCQHILSLGSDRLQPGTVEACAAFVQAAEARSKQGILELAEVVGALARQGIEAVVIKGPVLARQIYPHPSLRDFRDLDLLVRPADRDATLAVLTARGYRSAVADLPAGRLRAYYDYNGQDILFAAGRYPLEPHWALAPRTFVPGLEGPPLIGRAVPVAQDGAVVLRGPAPEDALLVAALHGTKEHWAKLILLTDLAAMFRSWPRLDVALVLDRARQGRCERMLLVAVQLVQRLLGVSPPAPLAERAEADPVAARLAGAIERRLRGPQAEPPSVFDLSGFGWKVRDGLPDRLRYAARTLLTARTPHFRTLALPDRLAFLYPAVRLGLEWVIWPGWKRVRRLRSRSAMKHRTSLVR